MYNAGVKFVLVIALAVAGCKPATDGAPCSAVAGQFFKVGTAALDGANEIDATTRRRVHDQLPAMRDALDTACTEGKWSRVVRDCIAKANDHQTIAKCEEQLTPAQRLTLEKSSRTVAPTP